MQPNIDLRNVLTGRKKGTLLRPVKLPMALEVEGYRITRKPVDVWAARARSHIIPMYGRLYDVLTRDDIGDDVAAELSAAEALALSVVVDAEVIEWVDRIAARHLQRFVGAVKVATGYDIAAFMGQHADELAVYREWAASLIRDLNADTRRKVQAIILDGLSNREAPRDVAKLIREAISSSRRRALLIASDQANKIHSRMQEIRAREVGITQYIWRTAGDGRVRLTHATANGKRFSWDKPPSEIGRHPGEPIRCFLGSNTILANHGINRLFRRLHTGETATVVLSDGTSFDATPNHPMLTESGWVKVEGLEVGDNLVKTEFPSLFAGNLNVEKRNPSFDQFFDFMRPISHQTSKASGGDLYGEAAIDENIDIVEIEGGLLINADASRAEGVGKFILKEALVASGVQSPDSVLSFLENSFWDTPDGIVCGLREFSSLIVAHFGHADSVGGGAISDIHANTLEVVGNSVSADAVEIGQRKDAFTSDISAHHLASIDLFSVARWAIQCLDVNASANLERPTERVSATTVFGTDVLEHHPATKFFCRSVKQIIRKPCSHHVYSANTDLGWYIANETVAGNCRCSAQAYIPLLDEVS